MRDDVRILAGSASVRLTDHICRYLGVERARGETLRFSEGNLFVRVLENVRGREVYVVQTTGHSPNDDFMELLFWIDALKRASASSVTAVMPYFSYAKGDKKDEPRVSIRARVCADAIEAAGADRLVTLDLHAPQIQGFFRVPVDDLYALPLLAEAILARRPENLVVVSPDAGFVKPARRYASYLGASLAIADKQRTGHDERAEVLDIIGRVDGMNALIVDDFVASAGTLVEAAEQLVQRGARSVWAAVSHGLFTDGAMARLAASPIERLFVTDSIEGRDVDLGERLQTVSVAPLFGEAILRIDRRESISSLFTRDGWQNGRHAPQSMHRGLRSRLWPRRR